MVLLRVVADRIDQLSGWLGRVVSWLALFTVIVCFLVVLLRYGFDVGWVGMQEAVLYLNAALFMLGASYTLLEDAHVRVDVFYRNMSTRNKALVDFLGTLVFMVPMCAYALFISWGYVADSWAILEGSRESGGLPGLFLIKSLIPLFALLLLAQGISVLARSLLILLGRADG